MGGRVAEVSTAIGKPPLPWQRQVMDVALELLPDGELAYREVVLVVMRQQGKTLVTLPVAVHRALGWPEPQRILYTAQTRIEARKKWEEIQVPLLDASPLAGLYTTRRRLAAEAFLWHNGSVHGVGSTTQKGGGTGDTLDLGFIDEAWAQPDSRAERAMRPAMLTRRSPQLWVASMIRKTFEHPMTYLQGKVTAGRARVAAGMNRGSCYFEFSAPTDADPGDPATWWGCMPALGHTITEEAVAADYAAMDLVDFCSEYLGWIPTDAAPKWLVISELTWSDLADPGSWADPPYALCVDTTPEQSSTSIGVAGWRRDGDLHVELVDRRPGQDWAVAAAVRLVEAREPCVLVIDPNSQAGSLITPIERALAAAGCSTPVWKPNGKEVAAACARLYAASGQLATGRAGDDPGAPSWRVRHLGQDELTAAVAGARRHEFGGGGQWRWVRVGSSSDISPLYTVTLAAAGLERFSAASYDVLDSVFDPNWRPE